VTGRIQKIDIVLIQLSFEHLLKLLGNRETLWTLPRQRGVNMSVELDKFFQKYYSANIMRLAVLGPQSLDEMQQTVEKIFSEIPDKDVEMPMWNDPPYGPEELQRWIKIVPQSDLRALYFTVPVPYSHPAYKTSVSLSLRYC